MNDEPTAREPVGEDTRIDTLEERLKAAQKREEERTGSGAGSQVDENYRTGNRVLAELIGGIGGGAFLGWVIDEFINYLTGNSQHWGLLVMMFLGIIVAFRNIFRISNRRPD